MTEQERVALEQEVREQTIAEEKAKRNAYKAKWREKNREHLRQYYRVYRIRKKLCKGVQDGEE